METWTCVQPVAGFSLVKEPARSFPFLTDGEDIYLIEDWSAEERKPDQIKARRLVGAERARVERSLGDAAEEVYYTLGRSGRRKAKRSR